MKQTIKLITKLNYAHNKTRSKINNSAELIIELNK